MPQIRGLAVVLMAVFLADAACACSTFCLGEAGGRVFGKNYDWHVDAGLLIVNQRGVAKEAVTGEGEVAATWTSTHGSITFNQYGREFPSGGINEAGLVVELMWLDSTQYPSPDDRPVLGCLQWIQYQLDRHSTVADVIASDGDVRITPNTAARIHFLVADATGATATIEFLSGRLEARTGARLPVPALTNHPYDASRRFAEQVRAGNRGAGGNGSLERFARVAMQLDVAPAGDPVEHAFDILADVAQGSHTKWSIVYEIDRRVVHFKTRASRQRKHLALGDVDFACGKPVRVIDMNADAAGDLAPRLDVYSVEQNLAILTRGFREVDFLEHVPDAALAAMAHYPDRMECSAPATQSMD